MSEATIAELERRIEVLERALAVAQPRLRRMPGLMSAIIWAVAVDTGQTARDLMSNRRHRPLVEARHTIMWLARELTPLSLPQIARALGKTDHTTVMHGIARVEERRQADEAYADRLADLRATLEETLCG